MQSAPGMPPTTVTTTDRPLQIVVGGASGLVGGRLIPHLRSKGHSVRTLVRRQPRSSDEIQWDPARGELDARAFEGVDAVINLGGVSIAGGRWTPARKEAIRSSRVAATSLLARTIAALDRKPETFVSMSAVGLYGDSGELPLTEGAPSGAGFLADVCREWEAAAAPAQEAGVRVVHPRLGVVMAGEGGMLPLVARVFKLGIGGPLGKGTQYFPWIALDDLVAMLETALVDTRLSGPVNAVAPEETTNAMFTKALAQAVHRPAFFRAPASVVKLAGGELAETLILASQRVIPDRLGQIGFSFKYPTIDRALSAEMTRSNRNQG